MGFMLLIFAASLFRILKYFKLNHIIVKSVRNQVIFHIIEGILFLYALYLMDGLNGLIFGSILFYLLMFLPLSVYQVRYSDDKK